jgi:ADP-glucose pyrophosphorylase
LIKGKANITKSIITNGCIINDSEIENSILSYHVEVSDNTRIKGSFLMGYNQIGKNVNIRNTIIDTFTYVPDNTRIGIDKEEDLKRKFKISANGITVVPRRYKF